MPAEAIKPRSAQDLRKDIQSLKTFSNTHKYGKMLKHKDKRLRESFLAHLLANNMIIVRANHVDRLGEIVARATGTSFSRE